MVKILVVGDLHGAMPQIHFKDFDCIIQVGDVCGDGDFRKYVDEMMVLRRVGIDISSEELILNDVGEDGLLAMSERSLMLGHKVLKKLNSFGKPVFFVPGNWDQSYGETNIQNMEKDDYSYFRTFIDFYLGTNANKKLLEGLENIYDCQYKLHNFLGFNIIGFGLTSGPDNFSNKKSKLNFKKSQFKKLFEANKKIENRLNDLFKKRNKKIPTIFLSHNVIAGTKLDLCLDKRSPVYKKHLGSDLGEKLCKKYNVCLAIGGHVHDNYGKCKLKNTTVINSGFGKYVNTLIDLDLKNKKIKKIQFWDPKKQYDSKGRMKKLLK